MKKLLFTLLLVSTLATSAFAKDPNKGSYLALKNFQLESKSASNITWTKTRDYLKATFTFNKQKMEAFYNEDGERFAFSSGITLGELPIKAKRFFAKKFDGYNVKEAILFEGTDEIAYYISAENDKESLIVKIAENREGTSIFKRTKK